MKPCICAIKRTPVGKFLGGLSGLHPPDMAALAISSTMANLPPDLKIDEVMLGNVASANLGQAPARQAALKAGLPQTIPCTTINKVCSSGMKSVCFAAQAVKLGYRQAILCGGFESMSRIPHYTYLRKPETYGHGKLIDGLLHDGLTDVYSGDHMGVCTEVVNKKMGITREMSDNVAELSYTNAIKAQKSGHFKEEIVEIRIAGKKEIIISEDEEYGSFNKEKMLSLKPAFQKDGVITAANASKLSDGACTLVIMMEDKAKELGIKPLARIISFDEAALAPVDFTMAPVEAAKLAMKRAGMELGDIDYFEANEAFSTVPVLMQMMLGVESDKLNVHGGAVGIGHPLGMSGARILRSLITVLQAKNGNIGLAGICNGGGGATAMILERMI